MKGAPEKILQSCTKFSYRGTELSMDSNREQEFLAEAFDIGRKGLRGRYNCEAVDLSNFCNSLLLLLTRVFYH